MHLSFFKVYHLSSFFFKLIKCTYLPVKISTIKKKTNKQKRYKKKPIITNKVKLN